MWSVMQIAARFQQGFDRLRADTQELARDIQRTFRGLSDETLLLLFVLFILWLFYMIVRQPENVKGSGGMGRQFVFAVAIVVIFSFGIDWVLDHNGVSKVVRV